MLDLGDLDKRSINEAIENIKESCITADVITGLEDKYGREIAEKVKEIYDLSMDCPVDRSRPEMNMDKALEILAAYLELEMSFLSPLARRNLNYLYIMAWK